MTDFVGNSFVRLCHLHHANRRLLGTQAVIIGGLATSGLLVYLGWHRNLFAIKALLGLGAGIAFWRFWLRLWILGRFTCSICGNDRCNPPEPDVSFNGGPVDHDCAVRHKDLVARHKANQDDIAHALAIPDEIVSHEVRKLRSESDGVDPASLLPACLIGQPVEVVSALDKRDSLHY